MRRLLLNKGWLPFFLICVFAQASSSQSVTGIWRGYFISEGGQQYRLEFQVKQNVDGSVSVKGVSYSWQDDIRFYGKATMTGNFIKTSQNFRIREIKTVELKNPGGGTCIMNYDLRFSESGKEQFLEGTYLGKPETKQKDSKAEWGDCGGGRVFLRKVTTTDFYVEPFLRNTRPVTTTPRKNTAPPPSTKTRTPVTKPPGSQRVTTTPRNNLQRQPVVTQKKPELQNKPLVDTNTRIQNEVIRQTPVRPTVTTPSVLKDRQNELVKSLVVHDPDVTVKIYDNGEIDDDSISVYLDKKLVLSNKRLTASALTLKLKMDEENPEHELVMVAENLGRIPPNTSLMVVEAGDQRFDVRITSTEQKNAVIRFRYEKP
ncbi:MAG TPA: hypothetical protein VK644_00040 [Chitinophagaceae bacterium]|nr:hypothetical protein [Chitinophagaceae bacterium]